jgi:hypothetical protein
MRNRVQQEWWGQLATKKVRKKGKKNGVVNTGVEPATLAYQAEAISTTL